MSTSGSPSASLNNWPPNFSDKEAEQLVQAVVDKKSRLTVSTEMNRALDEALMNLAANLNLEGHTDLLNKLLDSYVIAHEFKATMSKHINRLRTSEQEIHTPSWRTVLNLLKSKVPLDDEEEVLSVANFHAVDYHGQGISEYWRGPQFDDVIKWYAHMIVRAMWMLYDTEGHTRAVGFEWLTDPRVVSSVEMQVYILYNALLYKQLEEATEWKRRVGGVGFEAREAGYRFSEWASSVCRVM